MELEMVVVISDKETREIRMCHVCDMFEIKEKQVIELIESGRRYKGCYFDYPVR